MLRGGVVFARNCGCVLVNFPFCKFVIVGIFVFLFVLDVDIFAGLANK